jgi:hypothetical protein
LWFQADLLGRLTTLVASQITKHLPKLEHGCYRGYLANQDEVQEITITTAQYPKDVEFYTEGYCLARAWLHHVNFDYVYRNSKELETMLVYIVTNTQDNFKY